MILKDRSETRIAGRALAERACAVNVVVINPVGARRWPGGTLRLSPEALIMADALADRRSA